MTMPTLHLGLVSLVAMLLVSHAPDPAFGKKLALNVRPIGTSGLVWLGIRNASLEPQTICITDSMWTLIADGDSPAAGQWEHQGPGGPCHSDRAWTLILPGETHFNLRGERHAFPATGHSLRLRVDVIAFLDMAAFQRGQPRSELIQTLVPLGES
jgi:hypothetical protein